jgi:hypothetical protein
VALTDSSGVEQTTYGYDPYGNTSTGGAANDNQYQFTGRQNDGTGPLLPPGAVLQSGLGAVCQ